MPHLVSRKRSSNYGRSGPAWHIGNAFMSLDSFAYEVPSFNIKGDQKVRTSLGGVVTITLLIVSLAYSVLKGIQLV